jgi:hypothetical protein
VILTDAISQAQVQLKLILSIGNALDLPFHSSAFDISFVIFTALGEELLRYRNDQCRSSGGYVLALAEPDYGGGLITIRIG